MADSTLDRIVKGAPAPHVSPDDIARSNDNNDDTGSPPTSSAVAPHLPTMHDPRDTLPSSPPQIYLNLLILESSLRLQYLGLRTRLRRHVLLLAILGAWTLSFTYLLFFRPREDGSGVGGSVYWVLETAEKLGWCSGIVTLALFWGTGMYDRGVRWPRRFIATTNRGLRGFNMKVVVVPGRFLAELRGWLATVAPAGGLTDASVNFQVLPKDIEAGSSSGSGGGSGGTHRAELHWNAHAARHGLIDEDIAPGGDVVKLLLLPKPFSPDFRQGWETYRMEYWERENARRADLRRLVAARVRQVARRERGWLARWGWRSSASGVAVYDGRGVFRAKTTRQLDLEKLALREHAPADRVKERRRKDGLLQPELHSRSSSRSSTPAASAAADPMDALAPPAGPAPRQKPSDEAMRRGTSASGSMRRAKRAGAGPGVGFARLASTADVRPLSRRSRSVSPADDLGAAAAGGVQDG